MKLRIRDNSLRLRLSQSELKAFETEKKVEAVIQFPGNSSLNYSLIWGEDEHFNAVFDGSSILVSVSASEGKKWLKPEEISIDQQIRLADSTKFRLLIEKDFQCLSERKDEDESDMFPNPNTHC